MEDRQEGGVSIVEFIHLQMHLKRLHLFDRLSDFVLLLFPEFSIIIYALLVHSLVQFESGGLDVQCKTRAKQDQLNKTRILLASCLEL